MLSISDLQHTYEDGPRIHYPDWEVEAGNHSLILGGSGSGKTTLLHFIGGLLPIHNGTLEVAGTNISMLSQRQLDQFRKSYIGIVFQKPHLIQSLTVAENLALALYLSGQKQDASKIRRVLDRLNIGELEQRRVHKISQGQAQRVAIGRAVVTSPKLVLADEPTASLDDESCKKVIDLLQEEATETGATLLVATHDYRVKSTFKNQLHL